MEKLEWQLDINIFCTNQSVVKGAPLPFNKKITVATGLE